MMSDNEPNPEYVDAPYHADIIELKDGKLVHRVETEQPKVFKDVKSYIISKMADFQRKWIFNKHPKP